MTFLGNPDGMYHFCGEIVKFSADGEYKTEDTKIQEALKAAGFKVKKAVKAFLVWGKKRKKEVEENEEAKEFSFFPLAFIFSNAQVEQINLD